jgi:hypothetical protein
MSRIVWTLEFGGWLIFLGVCLLLPGVLQAQQTCSISPFLLVKNWSGTVKITGNGSGNVSTSPGETTSYNIQQSINLAPVVATYSLSTYRGPENATLNVSEQFTTTTAGAPGSTTDTITGSGFTAKGAGNLGAVLSFDPTHCTYSMIVDTFFNPFIEDGQATDGEWGPSLGPNGSPPNAPIWLYPLPTSGTTLTGSNTFDSPVGGFNGGPYPVTWTITWTLTPAPDALAVLVTIPNYDSWRPTGGKTEKDTGIIPGGEDFNLLEIQAQLVFKNNLQPTPFAPDKMTFSLVDVSHVPGVVMNWPRLGDGTTDPDMTFESKACFGIPPPAGGGYCSSPFNTGFTITDGKKADIVPPDLLLPFATAILLSPHDWGGWATLNVTATVGNQMIQGYLQLPPPLVSDPNETDILLPQRQAGSFIANVWKNQHGIPLGTSDMDDSESNPTGDPTSLGDGFTLYEEYRGFYMGCSDNQALPGPELTNISENPKPTAVTPCQHVEGDPKTKDFFVVDEMGVSEGIGQFAFGSRLNVHWFGLKPDEISPDRVINFNHAGAPHLEQDQHAVLIKVADVDAAVSDSPIGPPKFVDVVRIVPLYSGLTPSDSLWLDMVHDVAHELGHSVGVDHHGDIDLGARFWTADESVPPKIFEQAVDDNNKPVGLRREIRVLQEDQDPSSLVAIGIDAAEMDLIDDQGKPTPGRVVWIGNGICSLTGDGKLSGQHSGDVLSFMRYNVAEAYVPEGKSISGTRMWASESEVVGFDLTNHPVGTGVNAPGRYPRSRYGDAYAADGSERKRRGNDSAQIIVNDNSPQNLRPVQPVCP